MWRVQGLSVYNACSLQLLLSPGFQWGVKVLRHSRILLVQTFIPELWVSNSQFCFWHEDLRLSKFAKALLQVLEEVTIESFSVAITNVRECILRIHEPIPTKNAGAMKQRICSIWLPPPPLSVLSIRSESCWIQPSILSHIVMNQLFPGCGADEAMKAVPCCCPQRLGIQRDTASGHRAIMTSNHWGTLPPWNWLLKSSMAVAIIKSFGSEF